MARRFKITEEQYRKALDEGITLQADPSTTGGDEIRAIQNTRKKAQDANVDLSKATIQIPGKANESRIVSKSALKENRMSELKRNSKVYSVSDFISKLNKK